MEIAAYSTAASAPEARAAEWTRVIAEAYFPLQLAFREPESFTGQLERRLMGQVSLSRLATAPMQFERKPSHIAYTDQEEYLVTVPRNSMVEFSQLGRDVRCEPGGFILERGDEPAQVIDARTGLPNLLTSMMAQLQTLSRAETRAAEVLGRQIVEVLAIALDDGAARDEGVTSSVRAGHLSRAERVIRQNLSNPALSPEFVAERCGISKRYLHELFSDTDKTVAQFTREERLFAARDAIRSSRTLSMAEIAYRFGFSDQAQFSRLFKAQFDMTPSDCRRAALARD